MEKPAGAPVAPAHTLMLIETCVGPSQVIVGVSILVFLVGAAKAGSAVPDETAAAAADAAAILMKSRRERPDLPGSTPSGGGQESVVIVWLLLCWSPYPRTLCQERPPGIDCFARSFPFAGDFRGAGTSHLCPASLSSRSQRHPRPLTTFHLAQHKKPATSL